MINKKTERGRKSLQNFLESCGKFTAVSEYEAYDKKMLFKCNSCSFDWETTPAAVQQGKNCPACQGKVLTTYHVQNKLDAAGKSITVLSIGAVRSGFTCSCDKCGYEWNTNLTTVLRHQVGGCPSCSGKVRGSVEKLQAMFSQYNHNVTVLGPYVNNSTPIECRCNGCGQIFFPAAASVMYGSGCPFCCFKGRIPRGIPTQLYYVRVNDDSGTYWKVGITTKADVMSRFSTSKSRSKITVLYSFLFEDGEQAYIAEKNILRLYKEYLAQDLDILSDGNTEIFTKDVLQMNHLVPTIV